MKVDWLTGLGRTGYTPVLALIDYRNEKVSMAHGSYILYRPHKRRKRIDSVPKQYNYEPIFRRNGTQTANRLLVSRFVFDSLSEYPQKIDKGNWDKLSNHKNGISVRLPFNRKTTEKLRKSLHFGTEGYFCRSPPGCRCSGFHLNYDTHRRKGMFDKHSDFALNKLDKDAIVYKSDTGVHIRLTREDFASEEEFQNWKKWSDDDYYQREHDGREDDACYSLDADRNTTGLSPEDELISVMDKAQAETVRRKVIAAQIAAIKSLLTKAQYRRVWMYFVEELSMTEIAALEHVTRQRISQTLLDAYKRIVNNL